MRLDRDTKKSILRVASFEHSQLCVQAFNNLSNSENLIFISEKIKTFVFKFMQENIFKAKELQRLTSMQVGFDINIKLIYSLTYQFRKALKNKADEFSQNDFVQMCENFTYSNDSEPFILSYSSSPIRLLITTTNSLIYLSKADNLHLDATYKLTLYGFPVIVVGFNFIENWRF
jgi:hypothetical protein